MCKTDRVDETLDPIAEQLLSLPTAQREVLAPYWARAAQLVPASVPGLSYGMPALRHLGKGLVSLMPTKAGFSVYPYSSVVVAAVMARYPGHQHTKGSIRFTAAAPLPFDLFDDLVRTRLQELEAKKAR